MDFFLTFGERERQRERYKEDKFWVKGERRSHARETHDRSESAGCGLHQKVKKLSNKNEIHGFEL